jgi:hypothetical protein
MLYVILQHTLAANGYIRPTPRKIIGPFETKAERVEYYDSLPEEEKKGCRYYDLEKPLEKPLFLVEENELWVCKGEIFKVVSVSEENVTMFPIGGKGYNYYLRSSLSESEWSRLHPPAEKED